VPGGRLHHADADAEPFTRSNTLAHADDHPGSDPDADSDADADPDP